MLSLEYLKTKLKFGTCSFYQRIHYLPLKSLLIIKLTLKALNNNSQAKKQSRKAKLYFSSSFPFHLLIMSSLLLFWKKFLLMIPFAQSLFSHLLPSFFPSVIHYFLLFPSPHSVLLLLYPLLCSVLTPPFPLSFHSLSLAVFQDNSSQGSFFMQTHTVISAICL